MRIICGKWRRRAIGLTAFAGVAVSYYALFFSPTPADNFATTEVRLAKRIPTAKYENEPLQRVFDDISSRAGIEIKPNWASLERCGMARETPIMLTLREANFRTLLRDVINCGASKKDLQFLILDNGTVVVCAADAQKGYLVERQYDARPFGYVGNDWAEKIEQLITDTVDNKSWSVSPPSYGTIRHEDGWIIAIQTPQNQREIDRLMQQLYETRATPSPQLASRLMESK